MFTSTKSSSLAVLISTLLVATAFIDHDAMAQASTDTPPYARARGDLVKTLGLDDARATQLRSILFTSATARHALMKPIPGAATDQDKEAIRAEKKALHDATYKEVAALLTAEELAKFDELMPKPHKRQPSN
jgi:hypothetical protein